MATYTYEQFEKAAKDSGLYGQFSEADLNLALKNPDAGMSILKYKQDYASATTDEARALANQGAENIRSSYGEYTGGDTGGSFYLNPLSPGSFTPEEVPEINDPYGDLLKTQTDKLLNYGSYETPAWEDKYGSQVDNLWNQQSSFGDYSYDKAAPTYTSRYDGQIQDSIAGIVGREDFSYDAASDPLYQQYRKQYAREGQRATADALGQAAAASGGIPSSYAATAAAQAGNYYSAQMTDKIPELYELAYNQYMNDFNMDLNTLSALQNAEALDYDKFLNQQAQYNTDRNFDYGVWQDKYNRSQNDLQTALQLQQMDRANYESDRAFGNQVHQQGYDQSYSDLQALLGLSQYDYQKQLDERAQVNLENDFGYSQMLDEINSQTNDRSEAVTNAQLGAEYGDYSGLKDLGIDTSTVEWEQAYNEAVLRAQYGDYSGLRALGIDTSAVDGTATAENALYTGGTPTVKTLEGDGTVVTDDNVIDYAGVLEGNGFVPLELGSQTGTNTSGAVSADEVYKLGFGPISGTRLFELVEEGKVQKIVTDDGAIMFRRVG